MLYRAEPIGLFFAAAALLLTTGCSTPLASGKPARPDTTADTQSLSGRTPEEALELEILLTRAAGAGDVEAVQRLLAAGADPDGLSGTRARVYRQANGLGDKWLGIREPSTPILAALNGEWDDERGYVSKHAPDVASQILDLLLKAGADPNIQDSGGSFALESAVNIQSLASVKLLINAGANVKMSSAGYPVIGPSSYDPVTLIDYAVLRKNIEILRLLLQSGADPYEGRYGFSPLARTAHYRHPQMLRVLLEYMDADYGLEAHQLNSALYELIEQWPSAGHISPKEMPREQANWFDCFVMLIERGATLHGTNHDGSLDYDIKQVQQPTFHQWLDHADRQGLDQASHSELDLDEFIYASGLAAFRRALRNGDLSANQQLYDGLSLSEPSHIIFDLVYQHEAREIIRLFVKHGMDVNARNTEGRTLLHYAASDYPDLIPLLLDNGAEVNPIDVYGSTPLDELNIDDPGKQSAALLKAHGAVHGDAGFPQHPEIVTTMGKAEPRLEKLLRPDRRAVFEKLLAERRYIHRVEEDVIYRAHNFKIDRVRRYELPEGPDAFIAFDQDKDAHGRSRFIFFRGDGAMLPRRSGEQWRLRESDIVDLDADGIAELLIDITITDGQSKIGALRMVSMNKPGAMQWALVYPHRDEPGGFEWELGDVHWTRKTRKITIGPSDGSGKPLWQTWQMTYDDASLTKQFDEETYDTQIHPYPMALERDDEKRHPVGETAGSFARKLYPHRYR